MTALITGARGSIARNVIAQLLASGEPVRAASREPAATDLPDGVAPVRWDLADPGTLAPALDDVDKVFLYAASDGIDAFITAAKAAGVERVVLLSSAAAADPGGDRNEIGRRHLDAERPLEASGLAWTFVRPAMFATNALWWAESIREAGVVRIPYPDALVNPIHERDIAEVAVAALTEDGHAGRAHLVDGPRHLTQRRQVELIGEAVGREIAVEELPRAAAARFMPEPLLDMLAAGRALRYGPTSEAVTGRPARTFEQWAADHAADFK
jgi:uncharacterized protein YbjT (DUF2867 family)